MVGNTASVRGRQLLVTCHVAAILEGFPNFELGLGHLDLLHTDPLRLQHLIIIIYGRKSLRAAREMARLWLPSGRKFQYPHDP